MATILFCTDPLTKRTNAKNTSCILLSSLWCQTVLLQNDTFMSCSLKKKNCSIQIVKNIWFSCYCLHFRKKQNHLNSISLYAPIATASKHGKECWYFKEFMFSIFVSGSAWYGAVCWPPQSGVPLEHVQWPHGCAQGCWEPSVYGRWNQHWGCPTVCYHQYLQERRWSSHWCEYRGALFIQCPDLSTVTAVLCLYWKNLFLLFLSCGSNMVAIFLSLHTEYYLWCSDWLNLHRWLAAWNPPLKPVDDSISHLLLYSVQFSSILLPIKSSGGWFSRDPLPVFSAGGPCEQF